MTNPACPWCGAPGDGASLSCRACGAAWASPPNPTDSGWCEVPPIPDMARIEFGRSTCQVEGTFVPVADMRLEAGDGVYFAQQSLLWKEPAVAISRMPLRGAWRRLFAGLPLVMAQAHGPGHAAFSQDAPGEMIAVPLEHGRSLDVRPHAFLVASLAVHYDWFWTGLWFSTRWGGIYYPVGRIMDRFTAGTAPGLLVLHAAGNVFLRHLEDGEALLVKPAALLFKDSSVRMRLHVEQVGQAGLTSFWGSILAPRRCVWLRMTGPGRVAIQSAYQHLEDDGGAVSRSSPSTSQDV